MKIALSLLYLLSLVAASNYSIVFYNEEQPIYQTVLVQHTPIDLGLKFLVNCDIRGKEHWSATVFSLPPLNETYFNEMVTKEFNLTVPAKVIMNEGPCLRGWTGKLGFNVPHSEEHSPR
mmetsp:Transcript_33380/g.51198  ORF Transcript_33380/g.51198 Transcript_33380/m.51198 type:complete len:119 (+) Transcript_33380:2-358(+)